jgi:hypothetical protein
MAAVYAGVRCWPEFAPWAAKKYDYDGLVAELDRSYPVAVTRKEKPAKAQLKRKGVKERWDWEPAMEYLRGVLDERGDPLDPKEAYDGWRSEADAGRLVLEFMSRQLKRGKEGKKGKEPPDFSTVMRHVRPEMDNWRNGIKGHN